MVNWLVFLFRILDMLHVKTEIKKISLGCFLYTTFRSCTYTPMLLNINFSLERNVINIIMFVCFKQQSQSLYFKDLYIHAIKVFQLQEQYISCTNNIFQIKTSNKHFFLFWKSPFYLIGIQKIDSKKTVFSPTFGNFWKMVGKLNIQIQLQPPPLQTGNLK